MEVTVAAKEAAAAPPAAVPGGGEVRIKARTAEAMCFTFAEAVGSAHSSVSRAAAAEERSVSRQLGEVHAMLMRQREMPPPRLALASEVRFPEKSQRHVGTERVPRSEVSRGSSAGSSPSRRIASAPSALVARLASVATAAYKKPTLEERARAGSEAARRRASSATAGADGSPSPLSCPLSRPSVSAGALGEPELLPPPSSAGVSSAGVSSVGALGSATASGGPAAASGPPSGSSSGSPRAPSSGSEVAAGGLASRAASSAVSWPASWSGDAAASASSAASAGAAGCRASATAGSQPMRRTARSVVPVLAGWPASSLSAITAQCLSVSLSSLPPLSGWRARHSASAAPQRPSEAAHVASADSTEVTKIVRLRTAPCDALRSGSTTSSRMAASSSMWLAVCRPSSRSTSCRDSSTGDTRCAGAGAPEARDMLSARSAASGSDSPACSARCTCEGSIAAIKAQRFFRAFLHRPLHRLVTCTPHPRHRTAAKQGARTADF
jgi:hypothetical protein